MKEHDSVAVVVEPLRITTRSLIYEQMLPIEGLLGILALALRSSREIGGFFFVVCGTYLSIHSIILS